MRQKQKAIKSRFLAVIIALEMLIGSMPINSAAQSIWSLPDNGAQGNADVYRFGLFSDTHIVNDTSKFSAILQAYKDMNINDIVMVGDIVYMNKEVPSTAIYQEGNPENNIRLEDYLFPEVYAKMKNAMSSVWPPDSEDISKGKFSHWNYIYATGNHEFAQNSNSARTPLLDTEAIRLFEEEIGQLQREHIVLGGYHFIKGGGTGYQSYMTLEDQQWIMNEIDKAIAQDGNKPVFLLLHHPIHETVYGSDDAASTRYSEEFKSFLLNRPQVINFTAHIHTAAQDPKSIWQGETGFTVVHSPLGGGGYLSSHGTSEAKIASTSQAMMVEVENNVVYVHKMDLVSGQFIGQPWVIDVPGLVSGAAPRLYTNARFANTATPEFPENAKIEVNSIDNNSAELTFTQAVNQNTGANQDGFVQKYRIKVIDSVTGTTVADNYYLSDFYNCANPSQMAETLTKEITGLSKDTKYDVEIYAISPFEMESTKPLSIQIQTENAIRIEAEDYVDAITDMTVYTIDRGRVVSFRKDQWMLYEVDIPQDGKYQLSVVGSNENNIIMTVTVDEATSGGGVVPSTGSYNIYKETAIFEFIAAQGIHTIKLSTSEGFSFDYFELVRIGDMADFTIKLEAEMPDAYSTNPFDTSQQRLRAYPRELASGGYAVGWNTGEWISYNINIPLSGKYKVTVIGWADMDGVMDVYIDGEKRVTGNLPSTGSWSAPPIIDVMLSEIDIYEGNRNVRFLMVSGAWTVDCITFERIGDAASWTTRTIQAESFNLQDGQGVGFYDNTPDGLDFEWYDPAYSPVEVGNANGGKVVGFAKGEWLKYNVMVFTAGMYEIKICHNGPDDTNFEVSANDISVLHKFVPKTGEDWNAPYSETVLGKLYLTEGKNIIKVKNLTASMNFDYYVLTYLPAEPISGINILREAEDFAENIGATLYEDGETKVMDFNVGNKLTYNVSVPFDGVYELVINASTSPDDVSGAIIRVTLDGIEVDSVNTTPSGGWQAYIDSKIAELSLSAGNHTVALELMAGSTSFDYFALKFKKAAADIITVRAVDYNPGGQNVGYYDNTPGVDQTGYYIERGDDVEVSTVNGNLVVVMDLGEWLKYDVQVDNAGYYEFNFVGATPLVETMIEISASSEFVSKKALYTSTWDAMRDNRVLVELPEGLSTIKVHLISGAVNFEYFTLKYRPDITLEISNTICQAVNTALYPEQVRDVLDSYADILCLDTMADTEHIFYSNSVFANMIGLGCVELADVVSAYADSILKERTNPTVALHNGDSRVTALESGQLSLKIDTSIFTKQAVVIAAIYKDNVLYKIVCANSQASITEIELGEVIIDTHNDYTFKLFYWEDLINLKPYNPYGGGLQVFVSPNGNDNNTGTLGSPVLTISKAQQIARALAKNASEDVIVNIAPGEYTLSSPLFFNELDSAEDNNYIIYRGSSGAAKTVLSGGIKVENWTRHDDKIWKTTLDNVSDLRNLYVNGVRAQRAQSATTFQGNGEYDYPYNTYQKDGITIESAMLPEGIESEKDLELVWDILWTRQRLPVKGIQSLGNGSSAIVLQDGTKPFYQYAITKLYKNTIPTFDKPFKIENAFVLLDSPGEFYFDKMTKTLYYYPRDGEDLQNSDCYIGQSEGMLMISGESNENRVKNLRFENLHFRYGDWLEVNDRGVVFTQADKIVDSMHEPAGTGGRMMFAQIQINWADNVVFKNNTIENVGSAGLSMQSGVQNCVVEGNTFRDTAAGAIIVGDWNHVFLEYNPIMCRNITIKNNYIRDVAYVYGSSPAISVYYTYGVEVSHNDIANTAYSGISMGWGWNNRINASGNNKIEYNRVENVMTVLQDGANIYTLGAMPGTVIRGNYLVKSSDLEGGSRGGIYLDEGTAYISIIGNVVEQCSNWLFARPGVGLKEIYVDGNYTDTESMSQDTENVTVSNTMVFLNRNWPEQAQAIISNAGIN